MINSNIKSHENQSFISLFIQESYRLVPILVSMDLLLVFAQTEKRALHYSLCLWKQMDFIECMVYSRKKEHAIFQKHVTSFARFRPVAFNHFFLSTTADNELKLLQRVAVCFYCGKTTWLKSSLCVVFFLSFSGH